MRRLASMSIGEFKGEYEDYALLDADRYGAELVRAIIDRHGYVADDNPDPGALIADRIAERVQRLIRLTGSDDVTIVHVLSHGEAQGDTVQVVGQDGRAFSGTSMRSWMGDAVKAGGWVLFMVDVCHAGMSTTEAWQYQIDDRTRRMWVLAACAARQSAFACHFTIAAATVLNNLADLVVSEDTEYVPIDVVAKAIGREVERLSDPAYPQTVDGTRRSIAAADVVTPFFRNPHFRPNRPTPGPPELRPLAGAIDNLIDPWHFMYRARGAPKGVEAAVFQGRGPQLRALGAFVRSPAAGDNVRLVVGSPGTGKSALLGLFTCAAHPQLTDFMRARVWWPTRTDLPESPVDGFAAVHARGQTPDAVFGSVARQLGLVAADDARPVSVDLLIELLERETRRPTVLIDAIDEASRAPALGTALARLAAARDWKADPDPKVDRRLCRLILGSRTGEPVLEPLAGLVPPTAVIDLDATPRDEMRAWLHAYVRDLLRIHPAYRAARFEESRHAVADEIADRLAGDTRPGEAGGFLVAGMFVRALTREKPIADPVRARARAARIPRRLGDVLELELSLQASPWVRPVLALLAQSFGHGMPPEVIADCATLFAPGSEAGPTNADIASVLEENRFYLRCESDDRHVNVYRLCHETLVDHLRTHPVTPATAEGVAP